MKTVMFIILAAALNLPVANASKLKSCAKHLGNIRACIDIMPISEYPNCTSIIKSGEKWVDEMQLDVISEMYTRMPEYCDLLTNTVDFGGKNQDQVVEYCCGG